MLNNRIFKKARQCLVAAISLACVVILTLSTWTLDNARAQSGLNNASIQGVYAAFSPAEVRATINGSILSMATFDGHGNWTSSILRNTHVSDQQRKLESLSSFGTYELKNNGMGSAISLTQSVAGTISEAGFDFVITRIEERGGVRIAMEFYALPRLSSTGKPAGIIFKRRPDQARLNNSGLQGTYALTYFVGSNESAGLGTLVFNGEGVLSGQLLANTASPQTGASNLNSLSCAFPCLIGQGEEEERQINVSLAGGSFSVQPDGTGTMTIALASTSELTSEMLFDILITRAESTTNVITELIALQQEPEGNSGGLRTLFLTRVSD